MGAFDGLNLYQERIKITEPKSVRSGPKTYYVSWYLSTGLITGKHYRNRNKAIRKYQEKLGRGMKPSKWFS